MQERQVFIARYQTEKEDWMQYLDALDGLRSQGYPEEPITTKCYEILQRSIEGVRDPTLRCELSIIYESEATVACPPTVESLWFTTRQLHRNRPKQPQPHDPRHAMRSRPHPFLPLQPNKMVVPQGALPPPPAPSNPAANAGAGANPHVRAPMGACFNCGHTGHFARECPDRDQARKHAAQHENAEAVKITTEDVRECVAKNCVGAYFCVNCGTVDHVASQCGASQVGDEFAYSRWAEAEAAGVTAQRVPLEDDRCFERLSNL